MDIATLAFTAATLNFFAAMHFPLALRRNEATILKKMFTKYKKKYMKILLNNPLMYVFINPNKFFFTIQLLFL